MNNSYDPAPLWNLPWTYSTVFLTPPSWNAADSVYLVLDGAKMVADVTLNGVALGDVRSQFLRRIIPITPLLAGAGGSNNLSVTFPPANDPRNGQHRFMASSGSWDWAINTLVRTVPTPFASGGLPAFSRGLWKSVYLALARAASPVVITDVVPAITLLGAAGETSYPTAPLRDGENGPWRVAVTVFFLAPPGSGGYDGVLTVQGAWPGGSSSSSLPLHIPAGNSSAVVVLSAANVSCWWPAGLGLPAARYALNASFAPAGGGDAVRASRRVGFRSLYLVTADDAEPALLAGRDGSGNLTLRYKVNGADVVLRGANVVPMNDLEGRNSALASRRLVASAAEGGMNALRIWGGGVFQYEAFYDEADDRGVLLLQDLMFVSAAWSADNSTTTEDELRHNVRRLSHHPSVAVYHGCNECEPDAGAGLVASFALPIVAAEDPSRPIWPASPSAGWAGGVDRLTGLPNGLPLRPLRPAPPPLPSDGSNNGGGAGARVAASAASLSSSSSSSSSSCTFISNATTPYVTKTDSSFACPSADACCAACNALSGDVCVTALYDGASCFIRGSGLLDRFWASDALWPARSGPVPGLPADFHGPYYAPNGWPTINDPAIPPRTTLWEGPLPAALPPPGSLGPTVPGLFNSEYGVVGAPSFESLAPALAPETDWGLHGPALWLRNYACDSAFGSFFPSLAASNFSSGFGVDAFRGQLFLCAVAQAVKLETLLAPKRADNYYGILAWQLNEIWQTLSWGSLEYGGGGADSRGLVVGGRWRPLHHLLARSLLRNVFLACGPDGRCLVRNDHPLEPFNGSATFALLRTLTGAPAAPPLVAPVDLPRGPAAVLWLCITGGDPLSPEGCNPLAPWLAAQGCADNGTDCVIAMTASSAASPAPAVESTAPLSIPGSIALPTADVALVTAAAAGAPNADGSINVTITTAASAMWIHLTTEAQGRFSDSAFHLWGAAVKQVAFIPFVEQNQMGALRDTLRVEHLRSYY